MQKIQQIKPLVDTSHCKPVRVVGLRGVFRLLPVVLLPVMLLPFMVSCQSMSPFYFEQLMPTKLRLQPEQRSILLVDQSPAHPVEGVHKVFVNGEYVRDTLFETGPASSYLIGNLEKMLKDGDRFDRVDRMGPLSQELSPDELYRLRDSLNFDLLLLLNQYELMSFMNTKGINVGHNVLTAAEWELLEAPGLNTLSAFVLYDTLRMGAYILRKEQPFWSLPDFETSLPELTRIQAQRLYNDLVPIWREAERFYYISGNYLIKMAVDHLRRDDWDGAAYYWKQAYERHSELSRYRSAFNLALYYERLDRPREALEWLEKAELASSNRFFETDAYELDLLQNWKALLRQRQKELDLLYQ